MALILAMGDAGQLRNSAPTPSPATPDSDPTYGLLALAADPLLAEEEENQVRPGAAPVLLSASHSGLPHPDPGRLDPIADEPNGRPRQTLGLKTPTQALDKVLR
jgi:hypothetical protein